MRDLIQKMSLTLGTKHYSHQDEYLEASYPRES